MNLLCDAGVKRDEKVTITAHLRPPVCTSPNSKDSNAGGEHHNVLIWTKAEIGCPEFSGEVCRCEFWGGPTMGLTDPPRCARACTNRHAHLCRMMSMYPCQIMSTEFRYAVSIA